MSKGSGRRKQQASDDYVSSEWERLLGKKVQKDPNHLARQTMAHKNKKREAKKRGEI